ncbi:MAG: hypothetical protein ACI4KH_01965 [Oscillospiraceae bacterium]
MKKIIAFVLVAVMSVATTGCMGKDKGNAPPEETSVTEATTAVTDEHTISIDFDAIEKANEVKTILKSVKRISVTEKYDGEITGKSEYYLDDKGHIAYNFFIGDTVDSGYYNGFSFNIAPEEGIPGYAGKSLMSADPYYYDEVNLSTLILYSREYYDINVDSEKIVFSVDLNDDYLGETVSLTVTVDKKTMRIIEMTDGNLTLSYSYENEEADHTAKELFDGEKSTATIIFNGHDIGNNEYTETFIVEFPKGWSFIPDELYIFNPYYDEEHTSPVDIGTFAPTGDYTLYLTDAMG